jgi:hypothetical protein
MRRDARHEARQAGGMDDADIPDFGDELGLYRLVRRAIERVQAKDIPEADKRAWIAYIEANYRAARAGLSDQGEPRALGRGPPDLAGEGGT